jgi:translation initiation factor IF-2
MNGAARAARGAHAITHRAAGKNRMSDTKDKDKDASAPARRPLTLKRTTGAGTVNQSFARGRTKSVVVEKKRKRVLGKEADNPAGLKTLAPQEVEPTAPVMPGGLSTEEMKARQRAIEKARAEEDQRLAEREREDAERAARAEEDRKRLEEERAQTEAARIARENAERAAVTGAPGDETAPREEARRPERERPRELEPETDLADAAEGMGGRVKSKKPGLGLAAAAAAKKKPAKNETPKRRGRMTIQNVFEDDGERQRSLASVRRARERERDRRLTGGPGEKQTREVIIPETITIQDLAGRMTERTADVIKYLMKQGQMLRATDVIDADTAELIVADFGHGSRRVSEADVELGFIEDDDPEDMKDPRPPVVTIMGHVDHGKTSLLDALRSTDVVSGEAGGITQHIGAYQVKLKSGERITFIDTPGHAAFSEMRARGANITDIVVLVVAADDGVMPQTIEAINHAKAAGAPIIVAVNKVDKPGAKPEKVLQDLLHHEIVVEAMGGDTQAIPVSALKKTGLEELTEAITLQAEVLELRANPSRDADGVVIESKVETGRGPVATLLVNRGTLMRGDIVVAGSQWGKVRALSNERGQAVQTAGPADPVEILGLDGAPEPGEPFAVVETEARARELTEYRARTKRQGAIAAPGAAASLEQMMNKLKDKQVAQAPVVVKADVQGSAEAIVSAMAKLGNAEVSARAIHSGVGGVNESDVLLAKATSAPILAFNVRANKQARDLAEREGVEIRYYSVIYNLLDDIRAVLQGMLAPERRETFLGYAQVMEVFNISKVGKVAGCRVTEGVVRRGSGVRLLRNDTVIHEGKLSTLKRFKDEVAEVTAGQECGMAFENYTDMQVGDQIECFEVTHVERTL